MQYKKTALQMMLSRLTIVAVSVGLASAAASTRQTVSPVSPEQVSSYASFAHFAGAAFCYPSQIQSWSCGGHCEANPSFEPFDSGGDGIDVPYWFVGYDRNNDTAIVAHQGINMTYMLSILDDSKPTLTSFNSTSFPGVPSSVKVDSVFSKDQAMTALQVLSAVKDVIDKSGTSSVTTVGYSLGAALSLLDSISLRLQLPTNISVRTILYDPPQVGNKAWASFVDMKLPGNVTYISNKRNEVSILSVPERVLGYPYRRGEADVINPADSRGWDPCPAQDDPASNTPCKVGSGDVPRVRSEPIDRDGMFDGISMSCNPQGGLDE